MKRRIFMGGAAAVSALAVGGYALSSRREPVLTTARNRAPLGMPPLLDTMATGKLELTAMAGSTDFLGGIASPTIGYNQAYLGPTIRMRNGPLSAMVQNGLDEPVTVHWHGLMVPGEHDGGPHQPITPGGMWQPDMQIRQPACTALYHSHAHGRTAAQVYAGLAGIIHIADGRDGERGLPTDYGVDDLTLVLQDRRFDSQGQMVYGQSMMDGMLGFTGDTMLVNGQAEAVAVVPKGVVRLRIVNASNARIYNLFAEDGRSLQLIATDGGYLPSPVALEHVRLGSGERVELLVDFSDGQPMALMSQGDPNQGLGGMFGGLRGVIDSLVDRSFPVLPFVVDARKSAAVTRLPEAVDDARTDVPESVAQTRHLSLDMGMGGGMMGGGAGGFAINGKPFDMQRIDLSVAIDSVERWIVSSSRLAHPFHLHGATFQVARENGGAPRPESRGWKDTVVIDSGGESELLVRFAQPATADAPYMYHCHILEHEDGGMMGQFTVS